MAARVQFGTVADSPSVSVVVPVRNGQRSLPALLDALAVQRGIASDDVEVIVVDNGSIDATVSAATRHALRPTVVRERRLGSYAARNAGLAVATAPVVAFTDADCVPDPAWLSSGLAAIEAGADLVGGCIVTTASPSPSIWERYDRAIYLDQEAHVGSERFAATANLLVRRAVFEDVGAFDADLRSGGDVEFGQRSTAAGYRLVYAPDAVVVHQPRTTLRETWLLHRRLGAGWSALARRGKRPPVWRDPALRIGLAWVAGETERQGARVRRRNLVVPHAVVLAARWTGRLTGRG
jgi:glycosyltransferase involved in cell wall biosynthesis